MPTTKSKLRQLTDFPTELYNEAVDDSAKMVEPYLTEMEGKGEEEQKAIIRRLIIALSTALAVLGHHYLMNRGSNPEEYADHLKKFILATMEELSTSKAEEEGEDDVHTTTAAASAWNQRRRR